MTDPATRARRSTDLELARLHLRLGALAIARAELETMAGRDALDEEGLVDLAEVRWRTGDVAGAGEAAQAVLRDREDGPLMALVVAAEAAMALGRPTEARRLAGQAMTLAGDGLDSLFAGMTRANVWPADPAALPAPAPTLFEPSVVGSASGATSDRRSTEDDRTAESIAAVVEAVGIGLWDTQVGEPSTGADDAPALPTPDVALERGRVALVAGRPDEAAVQLAFVLRLGPALAPAVLDLVAGDRSAGLAFVRGDAYRLVGREGDARRAFADALHETPDPQLRSTDHPEQGDPA